MKTLLSFGALLPLLSLAQVSYDVTVTRLRALADDCDGGAITFCANAPQDPVFNLWVNDAEANEETYCWIFEDDNDAEYNLWKDIQDVQIASQSNVSTSFLTFDMSGFESDNLNPGCSSGVGDDAVIDREFVQQIDLNTLTEGGVDNVVVLSLQDVYFAEVIIQWTDLTASTHELPAPSLSIAPNPNSGSFTLATTGIVGLRTISVHDMTGRIIYTQEVIQDVSDIHLGMVEPGNYLIHVTSDYGNTTEKLIVR
jgi:hypothetical protein